MAIYPTTRAPFVVTMAGTFTGQDHVRIGNFRSHPSMPFESWFGSAKAQALGCVVASYDDCFYTGSGVTASFPRYLYILPPFGSAIVSSPIGVPSSEWNTDPIDSTYPSCNWYKAFDGSWQIYATVQEFVEFYTPTDVATIGGTAFPAYAGTAQADGLPAEGCRYFLKLVPGTNYHADVSTRGVTQSYDHTVATGEDYEVGLDLTMWAYPYIQTTTAAGTIRGTSWGDSASVSGDHATATFSPGSVVCSSTTGGQFAANRTTGLTRAMPDTLYDFSARLRAWADPYPSTLTVTVADKQRPDGTGTYVYSTQDLTANPNCSLAITQKYSVIQLLAANPGDASAGQTQIIDRAIDEREPVSAWLKVTGLYAAGEDDRDWRMQTRGTSWTAGTLKQVNELIDDGSSSRAWASSGCTLSSVSGKLHVVVGSGGPGSISRALISPLRRVEGARFLKLLASCDTAAQPVTLTLGGQTFSQTIPDAGTIDAVYFDLLCSDGETETVETKDSRFPIANPGGFPTNNDPVDQYKLGWGVQYSGTLTLGNLAAGRTYDFDEIDLVARTSATFSVAPAFSNYLTAWTSATDNTTVKPFLILSSDGKPIDWPDMAHVSPFSGSDYYRWYSISELAGIVSYLPNWQFVEATSFPSDGIHTNGLEATRLCGSGATWDHSGTSGWTDWVDVSCKGAAVTLIAQDLWDEVSVWPGAGEVWTGGAYDVATKIRMSKSLRGEAWGAVFKTDQTEYASADVVAYETANPATTVGSAVTDTYGSYQTGLPYGRHIDITTELRQGEIPYLSDHKTWVNRFRERTSFRKGATTATALWLDADRFGRHARGYARGTAFYQGMSGNADPIAWNDQATPLSGTWARGRFLDGTRSNAVAWLYGDGTTAYFATSIDDGATFGAAVTIGSYTVGDFDVLSNGTRYFYMRNSSGAIYGMIVDAQGNTVRAAFATSVTGVDDAPICVRLVPAHAGKLRIELEYRSGGSLVHVSSTDATNFS